MIKVAPNFSNMLNALINFHSLLLSQTVFRAHSLSLRAVTPPQRVFPFSDNKVLWAKKDQTKLKHFMIWTWSSIKIMSQLPSNVLGTIFFWFWVEFSYSIQGQLAYYYATHQVAPWSYFKRTKSFHSDLKRKGIQGWTYVLRNPIRAESSGWIASRKLSM